jgi:hypothetical protein
MSSADRVSIKVEALPPQQSRFRFRRYLPFYFFIGFVGWTFTLGVVFALVKGFVSPTSERTVAIVLATAIVFLGGLALSRMSIRNFAGCKLEVTEDRLVIHAPSAGSIIERRFPIDQIQEVVLGRQESGWERFQREYLWMAAPVILLTNAVRESARSGILTVRASEGSTTFHAIDKIFDRTSINGVINELARRGVKIRRIAVDID